MKPYSEVAGQYSNHNNMLLPMQSQLVEPDYISVDGLERARFNSAWWTRAKHPFIGATKRIMMNAPQFLGNTTALFVGASQSKEVQQSIPIFGSTAFQTKSKEQIEQELEIARDIYGGIYDVPEDAEQYQKDFAEVNRKITKSINDSLWALTDKNRDWVEKMFPTPIDSVDRYLQDVGGGAVSNAEAFALLCFAGPLSPLAYFGFIEAGQKFREMDEAGVGVNKAFISSTLSGFIEGSVESISTYLTWNLTVPWLVRGGVTAVVEGIEEILQNVSSDSISYIFGSRDWEGKASAKQMVGSALYAGSIGAMVGGITGLSLAGMQRNRIAKTLEAGGMNQKQAKLKANELMAKTATQNLEEIEKNLFGQMIKENAVVMDAITGKTLTGDAQQILNDVYQRYVDEGLIKQEEGAEPTPAVKASAIDLVKSNMMDQNTMTQDPDIVEINDVIKRENEIRESILMRDGNEKALRKIETLAQDLGVRIGRIRYEDTQHFMDWNNPEDQIVLRQHGETEESYNERIKSGRQLFKAGVHTTYIGRDGQQWSEIRLFRGFDATDIYHEFAHAVEEQGGIPGWTGSKEEHAHYIEKVIAEGREKAIAEFTKEGGRIDRGVGEKPTIQLLETKMQTEISADLPTEITEEEARKIVEDAGGKFKALQSAEDSMYGEQAIWWDTPSGSTQSAPISEFSADLVKEKIDTFESKKSQKSLRESNLTRKERFEDMKKRIEEIRQKKGEYKEELNLINETLSYLKGERKAFKNSVIRYKDGYLDEEYNELPVYYRSRESGQTLDELATDNGFSSDMEFRDYLIDIDNQINNLESDKTELRDKIQDETNAKVVKSEIDYLKQRLSDYQQGKFEGKKELQAIKDHLGQIARKVLPVNVRWKALTLVQNVNEKNFADYMNRIANIYQDYETWLTRGKAIKKLLKTYKHPENVVDVRYQELIDKMRERLGETKADRRKTLRDMSTEELLNLARKVAFLEEKGKMSYKQREENRAMAREIMRASLIRASGGEIDPGVIGSYEERKLKGKGFTAFRRATIRPIEMIERIFGQHGKDMVYSSIDWAETIKSAGIFNRITRIKKAFRDFIATKDNKLGDVLGQHNIGHTVTIDGVTFQMNEIMAMYAQKNNEFARKAIIHGNNMPEELYDKFTAYLEESHPEYVKFANAVKEVVGDRYEDARRVMADTFNITMPKESDYFPMFRIRFDAVEDPEAKFALDLIADADIKSRGGVDYADVEKGFTIARQEIADRNQQPISLDFMGDALRAIETQEHFINFAKIQKMINGIKGDQALRNSVTYNHGVEAWEALDAYLNNAINPRMNKISLDVVSKWARKVRKAMGVSYLGFNIVTALKQFPSAHFALPWTNPAQLYTSMARVVGSAISDGALIEEIYELDPSIRNRVINRDINDFQKNYPKLARNDVIRGLQIANDELGKSAFGLIMMMDKWAVLSVYDSVYQTQRKKVGDAEARKIAHEVVIKTQPQGRMIDLPELYRTNNEFLRMALMFTNQLNQVYNMMREGLPSDITNQQYGRAVSRIASIMVSSLLIYLASHGGKFPDEDDDERVLQWIDAIAGSSIASLPIVGNLIMSKARGYSTALNPTVSVFDSLEWSLKKMGNDKVLEGATEALINVSILAGVGIPYSQPRRTIKGALDIIDSETEDWRRLIWSKSALNED